MTGRGEKLAKAVPVSSELSTTMTRMVGKLGKHVLDFSETIITTGMDAGLALPSRAFLILKTIMIQEGAKKDIPAAVYLEPKRPGWMTKKEDYEIYQPPALLYFFKPSRQNTQKAKLAAIPTSIEMKGYRTAFGEVSFPSRYRHG